MKQVYYKNRYFISNRVKDLRKLLQFLFSDLTLRSVSDRS